MFRKKNTMNEDQGRSKKLSLGGAIITALILIVALIGIISCIEKIPPGQVGVVYSMNGGIQDEVLEQGWHLVAPTKHVKQFTISNEQLILTKDSRDGSEDDESFAVSTADNASIHISFQMSYRYIHDQVVDTYKKFKGMDGEAIVNSRVRTVLKAKISEITTDYSMMDIYSGDRGGINNKITEFLNEEFNDAYGIEVIDASIIDVHPDSKLQKSIDDRVTAMQQKQKAEADQATVKVENETKIMKAETAAREKKIAAEAEAEANRIVSASLTNELLRKMEMEARMEHGWVTISGADTIVTTDKPAA